MLDMVDIPAATLAAMVAAYADHRVWQQHHGIDPTRDPGLTELVSAALQGALLQGGVVLSTDPLALVSLLGAVQPYLDDETPPQVRQAVAAALPDRDALLALLRDIQPHLGGSSPEGILIPDNLQKMVDAWLQVQGSPPA